MKIIMLVGPENSGKTSALHQVLLMLKEKSKIVQNYPYRRLVQVFGDLCDFKCVAKYENKNVAFFTMGDDIEKLKTAINFYATDTDCKIDVLICACRTDDKESVENYLNGNRFCYNFVDNDENDRMVEILKHSVDVGKKVFDKLNELLEQN